jgi:hypothetical protein
MVKISFVMPDVKFTAAARLVASRVLEEISSTVPAPKPPRVQLKRSLLTGAAIEAVDTPSNYEKLAAALERQQKEPGFKEVAAYVAFAQPSAREEILSEARTTAVVAGLYNAVRVAAKVPVPA